MKRAALCALILMAACNPFANFDPESKSNEIVLELGARTDALGCAALSDDVMAGLGYSNVCAGMTMNPGDARDRITGLMRWSGARADGDWEASSGGFSRTYIYGDSDPYIIVVNNDAPMISYR